MNDTCLAVPCAHCYSHRAPHCNPQLVGAEPPPGYLIAPTAHLPRTEGGNR